MLRKTFLVFVVVLLSVPVISACTTTASRATPLAPQTTSNQSLTPSIKIPSILTMTPTKAVTPKPTGTPTPILRIGEMSDYPSLIEGLVIATGGPFVLSERVFNAQNPGMKIVVGGDNPAREQELDQFLDPKRPGEEYCGAGISVATMTRIFQLETDKNGVTTGIWDGQKVTQTGNYSYKSEDGRILIVAVPYGFPVLFTDASGKLKFGIVGGSVELEEEEHEAFEAPGEMAARWGYKGDKSKVTNVWLEENIDRTLTGRLGVDSSEPWIRMKYIGQKEDEIIATAQELAEKMGWMEGEYDPNKLRTRQTPAGKLLEAETKVGVMAIESNDDKRWESLHGFLDPITKEIPGTGFSINEVTTSYMGVVGLKVESEFPITSNNGERIATSMFAYWHLAPNLDGGLSAQIVVSAERFIDGYELANQISWWDKESFQIALGRYRGKLQRGKVISFTFHDSVSRIDNHKSLIDRESGNEEQKLRFSKLAKLMKENIDGQRNIIERVREGENGNVIIAAGFTSLFNNDRYVRLP